MKIKSLLIGMLASIALVGCTNEDPIDNGTEDSKQSELVRGDAYVSFVINTKTDSSRGVSSPTGAGNSGDTHGSADESGHNAAAVGKEGDVNEVLVVITKVEDLVDANKAVTGYATNPNGSAKLYSIVKDGGANDKIANGYIGYLKPGANGEITVDGTKVEMNNSIRLDYTGHYAIAVVVNPVTELRAEIAKNPLNHQKAYEAVLGVYGGAYNLDKNNEIESFQMSNKNEIIVNATPANNTPLNPAKPTSPIAVERTVSKATWRWTEPLTDNVPENLSTLNNLHPVTVNINAETPVTKAFWYKKKETDTKTVNGQTITEEYDTYYYSEEFHKAKVAGGVAGAYYWVLFKKEVDVTENGQTTKKTLTSADYLDVEGKIVLDYVEAIFVDKKEAVKHKGVIDDTNEDGEDDENNDQNTSSNKVEVEEDLLSEDYAKASDTSKRVTAAMVQSLTFEYITNDGESATKTYYVHLTHYALTNLTQEVYAVRHIRNVNAVERQFGVLGDNELLVTPYYKGVGEAFAQGLTAVTNEAKAFSEGVVGNTFKALPASGSDGTTDAKETGATIHDNKDVGGFMQYIYENSCDATAATAETVTGIVLAGDIYDETGVKVPVLYKYGHRYFRTLQALLEDNENKGNTAFANLSPNSTDAAVKAAGIDIYPSGRCFYYSAQIKHFDDGDPTNVGLMEYAIMRNNIYSLGVKSIRAIGDATLNLTPNTPISDIRSYVELEVSILPWIVRFNDLDL